MSKIIKAAELKILIPNESQTVIPAPKAKDLKKKNTGGTVLDAANLMSDAQEKAEKIVAEAKEEAKKILKKVAAEAEDLRRVAQEEGFRAGQKEGFDAGRKEVNAKAESFLSLLEQTVHSAAEERAKALAMLEEDFLKFSLILADKIVKKAVSEDVSWLQPLLDEGLARLGTVQQIIVRLHPEDYAMTQERQREFQLAKRADLQFEVDPTVTRGGCVIESEKGAIDGRLEKRLGKLAGHLLEVLYNGEE
ncbi:MAG TPA: hypothetical protein GX521_02610 [Firmicutes bacterium]|nr:hypothetical protein [Bacillota bacterium]